MFGLFFVQLVLLGAVYFYINWVVFKKSS